MAERPGISPQRNEITHIPLERFGEAPGGWNLWEDGKEQKDILPGMLYFSRQFVLDGLAARPRGQLTEKFLPDPKKSGVLIALQEQTPQHSVVGYFETVKADRGLDASAPLYSRVSYVGVRALGSIRGPHALFEVTYRPVTGGNPEELTLASLLVSPKDDNTRFISDETLAIARWEEVATNPSPEPVALPHGLGNLLIPPIIVTGYSTFR